MATQNDLFSYYTEGVSLPKLAEGKHSAKLIGDTFIAGEKPYIRFDWQLEDRTICDNRFEKGFKVLIAQARQVLELDGAIPVPEIMQQLRNKDIDLFVQYVTLDDGRTVTNYSLLPFFKDTVEAAEAF